MLVLPCPCQHLRTGTHECIYLNWANNFMYVTSNSSFCSLALCVHTSLVGSLFTATLLTSAFAPFQPTTASLVYHLHWCIPAYHLLLLPSLLNLQASYCLSTPASSHTEALSADQSVHCSSLLGTEDQSVHCSSLLGTEDQSLQLTSRH